MAFGSFDVLHPGHLLYLKEARKQGDMLVVVVARDKSIEMMKGSAPVFGERDRLGMVAALRIVDKAVLGNRIRDKTSRFDILKKLKPGVVVLGYDQQAGENELREWILRNGLDAKVVRINKYADPSVYKSSVIKARLAGGKMRMDTRGRQRLHKT